ncbi:Short chain dehydrogenase sol3 [Apiospora aurea]|uniref:Short chain dehydrogenase sol3 n=1 Tax=Apiospora aurea TaxID=335848 RepID=A0ABR1QA68_9PEZI
MATKFDTTPEKEAGVLTFFHRQLTFTPSPVLDVDLSGQTAIVTRSNVGVSLECSCQLLDLGLSKLILAVRDEAKGHTAAADLDYDSVVAFADRANKSLPTLDILIMNAALIPFTFALNPRTKHEEGFQVTHLSTALLTLLLLPVAASKRPRQKRPTRITLGSTEGAAMSTFTERGAVPLLPAFDAPVLAAVVPADKDIVVLNAASPGMCHDTQLARGIDDTLAGKLAKTLVTRRMGYTAAVGSRNVVDAAVNHGGESHGRYFSGQKIRP